MDQPGSQAVVPQSTGSRQGAGPATLALIALATSALPACSHSLTFTGAWPAAPVVVDGRGDDWAGIDSQDFADALYIAAANDESHVYLLLTTPRADVARTLDGHGFTLWIDGKARAFRVRGRGPEAEGERRPGRRTDASAPPPDSDSPEPVGESHALLLEYYTADGRADRRVIGGDCGAAAFVARTEDTWSWEIALPLTSRACPPIALGAAPGADIVIGLELALPEEGKKRPHEGREGGRRGGEPGTQPGTPPGTTPGGGTGGTTGGGTWGGGRNGTGGGRFGGVGEAPFAPGPDSPRERNLSTTEVALKVKLVARPAAARPAPPPS